MLYPFYKDIPDRFYEFDTLTQAKAVAALDPEFFFRCNVCDEIHARSERLTTWHDNYDCCKKIIEYHGANLDKCDRFWLPYAELMLAIKKTSPELKKIKMKISYFNSAENKNLNGKMWLPFVEGEQ